MSTKNIPNVNSINANAIKAPRGNLLNQITDYLLREQLPQNSGYTKLEGTQNFMPIEDLYSQVQMDNLTKSLNDKVMAKRLSLDEANKFATAYSNAASNSQAFLDATSAPNIKDYAGLAFRAAKQHPFKTMGATALGMGNIGGLLDNNKLGGQLGGLALGGLAGANLGVNPYTAMMLTMGGGELGALFDKLRAKKEQEQQEQIAQAQNATNYYTK